ncbi:hypothetical protein HK097_001925 [Rhizophlyctis rosea]|uniref:HNH nuclease domain-containing protein n=1 Tax=Rhizophlyctis rosea TaxID=64517 RepID=A0AAD5X8L7_9FUNG|nr:hypothetical protein HK097_001925 [Rhizophlyctis rosea]
MALSIQSESTDPPVSLLKTSVGRLGHRWTKLLQFLFVTCGKFELTQYNLFKLELEPDPYTPAATYKRTALNPLSEDLTLFEGMYALRPKESNIPPLSRRQQDILPIVPKDNAPKPKEAEGTETPSSPKSAKCPRAASTSSQSPSGSASRAQSSESLAGSSQSLQSDVITTTAKELRDHQFKRGLYQRDSHCLVTREPDDLEGAHVLSLSWWVTWRQERLPQYIRDVINSVPDGINDVRNGLLVTTDLAKTYDKGIWAIDKRGDDYFFVTLGSAFEEFDGVKMDVNRRIRKDGRAWSSFMPDAALLRFHLILSILNKVRGGAETEDEEEHDDDETPAGLLEEELRVRRASLVEYLGGTEWAEKLSNNLIVDDLLAGNA